MKLEVGMYVRTKDGIIDKVIIDYNGHCANPNCEYKHISCVKNYYDEDKIVKASYNIIDILEVGDYVNGREVKYIFEKCEKYGYNSNYIVQEKSIELDGSYEYDTIPSDFLKKNKDIKSVVTKEQFESMEYRIGDE